MEFFEFDAVVGDWEDNVYESEDLKENEMLEFFKQFDQVSPEIMCGFIIYPDQTGKSIYLYKDYTNTSSLEIDFDGYITILYESKAY
jgi:hypothetical protein